MVILQFALVAVEVLCAILLIIIILMQKARNEGMGLAFGAGMGEALFGSRSGNVLTKLTITFTVIFLANTLALSIVYTGGRSRSLMGRYAAPAAAQPMGQPGSAPARQPAAPISGAPTLPGASFEDEPAPAAPAEAPAQAPAEAPAQ